MPYLDPSVSMARRNWFMFRTAWLKKIVSSAKRISSNVVPAMRCRCGEYGKAALTSAIRTVMEIMNRYGDNGQPCLTPEVLDICGRCLSAGLYVKGGVFVQVADYVLV